MAFLRFLLFTLFILYFSANCGWIVFQQSYLKIFIVIKVVKCLLRNLNKAEASIDNYITSLAIKDTEVMENGRLCKIVLPHKLRYLENMLNAEVVAKAAKIRQRMEANPSIQDSEKGWPMLLAQYQADDKSSKNNAPYNNYGNLYNRRLPKF